MGRSTRQKKQQYVSMMWTWLFQFSCWKNYSRYSRWRNCARKTVVRMSCGRPWATSGNRITRRASTFHGRIDMGSSSSTDVSPADVERPPPALPPSAHPPAKPTSNNAGGKHHLVTHFPERPELRSMQTHNSHAMQKKSWRSGGQN